MFKFYNLIIYFLIFSPIHSLIAQENREVRSEGQLNWENIKGVQIKGEIKIADDKYWNSYLGEFNYISESETLTKAMKKVKLYKLKISWARFIDNAKGFGNKMEQHYT